MPILIALYVLFMLVVGQHCVDYTLWAVTGQDISTLADVLLAMFFGSIFLPASILLWVGGLLGVLYPLIQQAGG